MSPFKEFFTTILTAGRFYSVPISIFAWSVPFFYCSLGGGNIFYGLIALIAIVFLQMGVNSFDDVIDYIKERNAINKGYKTDFDFQEGKCICIFTGKLTLKQYFFVSMSFFLVGLLAGIFFFNIYGLKLLYVVIPTAILCILYPFCSYIGLGEIVVGIIYSPLLYLGVNIVMSGSYDFNILKFSISTALLTIAILHNHMLLDYKLDTSSRKITLCRISGNQRNALILLILLIVFAYLNLIFIFINENYNFFYLIPLLSIPQAIVLIRVMNLHIIDPDKKVEYNIFMGNMSAVKKAPAGQQNFLMKFLLAQNLLTAFTIFLCLSIILDKVCT